MAKISKYEHLYPQIREWFDEGWSIKDVADQLGLTINTVSRIRTAYTYAIEDRRDTDTIIKVWFQRFKLRDWRKCL